MAELAAPTLLLGGTDSPAWAVRSVRAYADAIPGPETRALDGQGHNANLTARDLLAAELERFLAAT
jgi:pimeloyl-ACP methyl ester carboxylesterase